MRRICLLLMTMLFAFNLLPASEKAEAAGICDGIKPGQTIYWDGAPIVSGQIGALYLVKDAPLYTFKDRKAVQEKVLKQGGIYRIYTFKSDYLGVGAGRYLKRDSSVRYKTPSKQKLQDLLCSFPKADGGISKGDPNASKGDGNGGEPPVTPPIPDPAIPAIKPIDLGPQVFNQSTIASKAGMDKNGNAYLYIILHGTPASLAVVDLNTNLVKVVHPLESSTSAWGLDVDSNGILWIGGTSSSNLYSYNPDTDQLKNFGNMLEKNDDTSIQDLTVNDQYVYGSTAYGANVFSFNKSTGKKEFLLPTVSGRNFAKSLAVDLNNQYLYVSSGPSADLLKWNLADNTKSSIIPAVYQGETYVDKMKRIDDFLAVKFYPSKRANLYKLSTGTFLNEFMVDSRGFSPKDEQTNEFYYTYQGKIFAYNLETGSIRDTSATIKSQKNALSLDFVTLKKNPSQKILTGLIDNKGSYYLFNPETNNLLIKKATLPSQPVDLNMIISDPDKRYIYANGFMTGGLTQYDTVEKKSLQFGGINQLESALFLNGKLYGGVYPKARLVELTPNQFWDQTIAKELIPLDKYGQERITALTGYNQHLFGGTYSQYSTKGGVLLDYDLSLSQYRVYEDYIQNQSIISLLADDTKIYGGTSIYANYQRSKNSAAFFRFNPLNPEEKEVIPLPVDASMVMSLLKGPDGKIWGAADGTIFSYDPITNKFRTNKLLKAISGRFSNVKLIFGHDGLIYGTMEGRMFKLNPADMTYIFLLTSGAYDIAEDTKGNIYYRNMANLYLYPAQ